VLGRLLLYGPSTALQKTVEEFQCEVLHYPKEVSILYQLFREGDRSKTLGFYSALSGEMANFPLFITASCEGYMVCVASVQNNTVIQPTVSERHHLRVVGISVTARSVLWRSVEFYEGKPLSLRCNITKGNHVSYQWLVDGKPLPLSPLPNQTQELFIYRYCIDSGEYICVATNQLNFTKVYYSRSTAKVIKLVSELDLLFLVLKERDGTYFALVTCQSLKGTPPITFSLYSRSEFISTETVDERFATFSIPVVLDLHMGFLQCQAENGDRVVISTPPVSVGGAVTMHYNTDVGENFSIVGLSFYCSVERGTFPQYRWFLNGTVLEGRGDFYWVENQPERSILLLSVGRSSAGTYHCDVSNSFDGTMVISSEERYIDKEVLNHLPTVVVAVVFGCFLFLVTLVTTCCFIGLLYRECTLFSFSSLSRLSHLSLSFQFVSLTPLSLFSLSLCFSHFSLFSVCLSLSLLSLFQFVSLSRFLLSPFAVGVCYFSLTPVFLSLFSLCLSRSYLFRLSLSLSLFSLCLSRSSLSFQFLCLFLFSVCVSVSHTLLSFQFLCLSRSSLSPLLSLSLSLSLYHSLIKITFTCHK
uniref:Si:dkey-93h22.7 n=1 Tax=Salmo trutta TaxID=8032 RepID=A0A674ADU3_SALTR